jgi:RNA polymerase subunit RPABC4/transcription elongation factor Spt4
MAKLKPCRTCGKEVAKSAKKCPHCGQKLKMGFFMKGIIGLVAIIIIVIMASNLGENSVDQASTTVEKEKTSKATGVKKEEPSQMSNEGISSDVTIKVVTVEDKQEVGNKFTKEKAQGIYKIVEVSLTNNQKDAITVDANSFKLIDDKSREFTYSSDAQIAFDIGENEGNSDFFLQSLNPGLTLTGKIVFDVPIDAKGFVLKARGGMMGKEITLKVE